MGLSGGGPSVVGSGGASGNEGIPMPRATQEDEVVLAKVAINSLGMSS